MAFILGKDGRVSAVRLGSLVAVGGIILIVVGVITFFTDQASRRVPLDVAQYPGAEYYGQTQRGASARRQFFRISGVDVLDVVDFYEQQLDRFNDESNTDCVRVPFEGNYPDYQPGNGSIAYEYKCIFDNSGFNSRQVTEVTIFPGVYDPNPEFNNEGLVVIVYDQLWES